jgi:protein unc-80
MSRKNSVECGDHRRDSEFVVLKERKLVPLMPMYNGMLRFSFLLEVCQPGTVPDAQLLAALLDLVKNIYIFFFKYLSQFFFKSA